MKLRNVNCQNFYRQNLSKIYQGNLYIIINKIFSFERHKKKTGNKMIYKKEIRETQIED